MKRERPVFSGWYKYQSTLSTDLVLPYETKWGKIVRPHGIFEGDSRFNGLPGVACIENLCHTVEPKVVEAPKQELLTEAPISEALQFFEADGSPLKKVEKEEELPINMVTKKELMEFAQLKGLKIDTFCSKEKILSQIREAKKHED
jgi:hypothetical protein